jgi:hypothetical protein
VFGYDTRFPASEEKANILVSLSRCEFARRAPKVTMRTGFAQQPRKTAADQSRKHFLISFRYSGLSMRLRTFSSLRLTLLRISAIVIPISLSSSSCSLSQLAKTLLKCDCSASAQAPLAPPNAPPTNGIPPRHASANLAISGPCPCDRALSKSSLILEFSSIVKESYNTCAMLRHGAMVADQVRRAS